MMFWLPLAEVWGAEKMGWRGGTVRKWFFLPPGQEKEVNSQLSSCWCQLSPRIPGNGILGKSWK